MKFYGILILQELDAYQVPWTSLQSHSLPSSQLHSYSRLGHLELDLLARYLDVID